MGYTVKTYWGIWLKRPRRSGDRPYPKMFGWALREMADAWTITAELCVPTEAKHGYGTREEADSAAFMLTSMNPWSLGWLEVRLFCGYRDQHGNFVATWCGNNR